MADTFRKEWKPISDAQKAFVANFKEKADGLLQEFIDSEFLKPDPRAMTLARNNLEQAVMWAVKSIT